MQAMSHVLPPTGFGARVAAMLVLWRRRLFHMPEDARVRAQLKYELECLDHAGELDGALNHIGLSRGAIPVLLRNYPGSIRRYAAMMRRLGIASDRSPSPETGLAAMTGTLRRCLFCSQSRRCEQWFGRGGADYPPGFCPNASAFERMRRRA